MITPTLDPPSADPEISNDRAAQSLLLRSAATGGSNDLKRLYLLLLASARRTVDITTPYFITDESTLWALADAARRGVRIRILTEGDVTDARPVKYSSRRNYEKLLSRGIELYEYKPTMMHTKVMVIDGLWSMFGSANLDNRSLELNDELNVAVRNAAVAARFSAMFQEDVGRAASLELDVWRERPLTEKAREQFWGYWGEIF